MRPQSLATRTPVFQTQEHVSSTDAATALKLITLQEATREGDTLVTKLLLLRRLSFFFFIC